MSEEALPIPTIPQGLRIAARRGVLVPFIGAGVSRLAGSPNWNEFADGALRFFINHGKFTHGQHEQIRNLNPRVKMSVALGLQQEHQLPIDFRALLHPSSNPAQSQGERLYAHLSKLATTFVTTNYDEWLDQGLALPEFRPGEPQPVVSVPTRTPRRLVHKIADLTFDNLNTPNTVVHLHGFLNDPDGMILTTRNYVTHYANDRLTGSAVEENPVLTFLEDLFREKSVMFVGYGLEELEILEYVILKARRVRKESEEPRHYIRQCFT